MTVLISRSRSSARCSHRVIGWPRRPAPRRPPAPPSPRPTPTPFAYRECRPAPAPRPGAVRRPSALVLVDVLLGRADRGQLVGVLVRDLDPELFLDRHDQFHQVER